MTYSIATAIAALRGRDWLQLETLANGLAADEPDSADVHFLQGMAYHGQHRFADAAPCCDRALKLNPSHLAARVHFGDCLLQLGRWEEAREALEQAYQQQPKHALCNIYLARTLLHWPQQRQTAHRHAIAAVGIAPKDPAAFHALALTSLRSADLNGAVKAINEALRLYPDAGDAQATAALIVAAKGDAPQAERMYRVGLAKAPWYAEGWINFAQLLLGMDRFADARQALDRGLKIKPFLAFGQYLNGMLHYRTRNYPAGVAALREAIRLDEDYLAAWTQLGDLLRLSRRNQEAITVLREALDRWPTEAPLWLNLGAALQQGGQEDAALDAYDRALALQPEQAAVLNNQGALLLSRQRLAEAEDRFERAMRLAPENRLIRINLARLWRSQGRHGEAEAALQEVLAQDPCEVEAVRSMVGVLRDMDRLEEAITLTEQAGALAPDNVALAVLRVNVLRGLGREDDGLALIETLTKTVADPRPLQESMVSLLTSLGRFDAALQITRAAADAEPKLWAPYRQWAQVLSYAGRWDEALVVYAQACERVLHAEQAYETWIMALARRQHFDQAQSILHQAMQRFPEHIAYYGMWANILFLQERKEESETILREGLTIRPDAFALRRQLVGQLCNREKFDEALAVAIESVAREPSPLHLTLVVDALQRARRYAQAVVWGDKLIAADPTRAASYIRMATIFRLDQLPQKAVSVLRRGLRLRPDDTALLIALVRQYRSEEDFESAVARAQRLIELHPHIPQHRQLLIQLLQDQGKFVQAEEVARQGVVLSPGSLVAVAQLYKLLMAQERKAEARTLLEQALQAYPAKRAIRERLVKHDLETRAFAPAIAQARILHAESGPVSAAAFLLFDVLLEAKELAQAEGVMRELLARRPRHPQAYAALAGLYRKMRYLRKTEEAWRKASEQDPNNPQYLIGLAGAQATRGHFDEYLSLYRRAMHLLGERQFDAIPQFFFNLNCHPALTATELYAEYEKWGRHVSTTRPRPNFAYANLPDPGRRLRIGYVSPDFRTHAVAKFSEPLLAAHDHAVVEVFAYAHLAPGETDAVTERFKAYADHWHEIYADNDWDLARQIRRDGIDILVDLAGHTAGNKLSVLQMRPAPLQASMVWGAGQTTGLKEIDYLIADRDVISADMESCISEKLAAVDGLGYAFMPPEDSPEVGPLPALTNAYVTFGSVARPLRINEGVVAVWSKLLHAVPRSRLLLDAAPYSEPDTQTWMRERFAAQGIDADRLILRNTRPYFGIFADMDIMLDTFPAGSTTTIIEGLWMGVPAVTLKSRPIMGMVPYAILHSMSMDEWAATTADEYVAIASRASGDLSALQSARSTLRQRLQNSPLFNHRDYARRVEETYRRMWQQWCATRQDLSNKEVQA